MHKNLQNILVFPYIGVTKKQSLKRNHTVLYHTTASSWETTIAMESTLIHTLRKEGKVLTA